MVNYHKPESKTVQELRDIAHRLRIHSITSTQASKSGYVKVNFLSAASGELRTFASLFGFKERFAAMLLC